MLFIGKLKIKSRKKIIEFLNQEHIGRIASIDSNGYPQIIPMNFAYVNNIIYMHSFHKGEKIDNIIKCKKVGFEVDRELEFLPSYFEDPDDASFADTLYISVIIKGSAYLVTQEKEKIIGLSALMKKYQPEGRYKPIQDSKTVSVVAVLKIVPEIITGKYKIGQDLSKNNRIKLAENILKKNSPTARETIKIMGFEIKDDELKMITEPVW